MDEKKKIIKEKLITFVLYFVLNYERIIKEYDVRITSRHPKSGKHAEAVDQVSSIAGIKKVAVASSVFTWWGSRQNRDNTNKLLSQIKAFKSHPEVERKKLLEAAVELFYMFEYQFGTVETNSNWNRALEKLAEDAVERAINYFRETKESFTLGSIIKGVLLGKSKSYSVGGAVVNTLISSTPGHHVTHTFKHPTTGTTLTTSWETSQVYGEAGLLVKQSNDDLRCHRSYKDYNVVQCVTKYTKKSVFTNEENRQLLYFYGYRRYSNVLSEWENGKDFEIFSKKLPDNYTQEYYLKEDDREKLAEAASREISKRDPNLSNARATDQIMNKLSELRLELTRHTTPACIEPICFELNRTMQLIERKGKLEEIRDNLVDNSIVVITGFAGVGKSELARKYAYVHRDDYNGNIICIGAATPDDLSKSFLKLVDYKFSNVRVKDEQNQPRSLDAITKDIYAALHGKTCLFVFDDAPDYRAIAGLLPELSETKGWRVLVTSKKTIWKSSRVKIITVQLSKYSQEEAEMFVENELTEHDLSDSTLLIEKLQHNPLALRQATAYIIRKDTLRQERGRRFTIKDYLSRFQNDPTNLMNLEADSDEYDKPLFRTLAITLATIEKGRFGKDALNMLNIISYFRPNGIPEDMFADDTTSSSGGSDDLYEVVHILNDFSIISLNKYDSQENASGLLSVHELVQEFRKNALKNEKLFNGCMEEKVLENALQVLASFMSKGQEQYLACLSHAFSVWNSAHKYKKLIHKYILKYAWKDTFFTILMSYSSFGVIQTIINELDDPHEAVNVQGTVPPLFKAMFRSPTDPENLHLVKLLLEKGAVCTVGNGGFTLLHVAAQQGHLDIVRHIINENLVDCNVKTEMDVTVLHTSGGRGHLDIVQYLCQLEEIDVNAKDQHGCTPLHTASKENQAAIVRYLISEHKADRLLQDKDGWTALHTAMNEGNFDVVKELIKDSQTDFYIEDNDSKTPLHILAQAGHCCLVRYVINEFNVDFNVKSKAGWTPLHVAAYMGNIMVVNNLLTFDQSVDVDNKTNNGQTALHLAATEGHQQVVKCLCDFGADCNARDNQGMTPLHLAAKEGLLKTVKILLGEGREGTEPQLSDAKSKSDAGWTVLHLAVTSGNLEITQYLSENTNVDCNTTNNQGLTAVHLAATEGHLDILKYLVDFQKINCSHQNVDGVTPLHLAAQEGHCHIVKFLANQVTDCNVQDALGRTPLHLAALNGHFEILKYLVDWQKGDYKAKTMNGWTLLHFAANAGDKKIVRWLLEKSDVDGSVRSNDGDTPLHRAAISGHLETVKYLIEEEKVDCSADKNGRTLLHMATQEGYFELVEYLIENQHVDIEAKDMNGFTAFHVAAHIGDFQIVRYLASQKHVDKNPKGNDGRTPLHQATLNGHIQIVQFLIEEHNVDFDTTDNIGCTPLFLAATGGHTDLVAYFIGELEVDCHTKTNEGNTPLHAAAYNGDLDLVKYITSKDPLLSNEKSRNGCTPLLAAAQEGHYEIVKYLIGKQLADCGLADDHGYRPLHISASRGHLEIVKYLYGKGHIDCNSQTNDGSTPIHLAAAEGHFEIVQFLSLQENANNNVNRRDADARTPLHWAIHAGHHEIVKYLIEEQHADYFLTDDISFTPLHMAASNNHLELVKYLNSLSFVDINAKSIDGCTALHLAAQEGYFEIVKYLNSQENVNSNARRNDGCTPLHIACMAGHLEIVAYLTADKQIDEDNDGKTPLHTANGKEIVKCHTHNHDNYNFKCNRGRTPMHMAAKYGHLNVVKYLIEEKHADFVTNNKGRTPLHFAAKQGHFEVVRYFLDEQNVVCSADNGGSTLLHAAARGGHLEIVKFLVQEKKLDYHALSNEGQTAALMAMVRGHFNVAFYLMSNQPSCLFSAASCGDSLTADMLLDFGFDIFERPDPHHTLLHVTVGSNDEDTLQLIIGKLRNSEEFDTHLNAADGEGDTPLMWAAENGHNVSARILLDNGANINLVNNNGETALHWAVKNCHFEVESLLRESGADVNIRDNSGKTADDLLKHRPKRRKLNETIN